jgi:hypothetical protein
LLEDFGLPLKMTEGIAKEGRFHEKARRIDIDNGVLG